MKKSPVPRGRNGGRKPLPESQQRLPLTIRLPSALVQRVRAKGRPTEVIERLVRDHLD